MNCPTCGCEIHQAPKGWQVNCVACGELRWPSAVSDPSPYTCRRCLSGAGAGHREAGRKGNRARAEKRRLETRPSEPQP